MNWEDKRELLCDSRAQQLNGFVSSLGQQILCSHCREKAVGEERAEAGANVFNFSFTIRQHHMEQKGAYRGKRDGCHFYSLSFLSEEKQSEFSAGSLSLARKVGFFL